MSKIFYAKCKFSANLIESINHYVSDLYSVGNLETSSHT